MAVNEGCGGAVTLCLAGKRATRGYEGLRGAEAMCTHIMNLGDGWGMGRHCDSVAASGALLLLQKKKKGRKEGRREVGRREEVH